MLQTALTVLTEMAEIATCSSRSFWAVWSSGRLDRLVLCHQILITDCINVLDKLRLRGEPRRHGAPARATEMRIRTGAPLAMLIRIPKQMSLSHIANEKGDVPPRRSYSSTRVPSRASAENFHQP